MRHVNVHVISIPLMGSFIYLPSFARSTVPPSLYLTICLSVCQSVGRSSFAELSICNYSKSNNIKVLSFTSFLHDCMKSLSVTDYIFHLGPITYFVPAPLPHFDPINIPLWQGGRCCSRTHVRERHRGFINKIRIKLIRTSFWDWMAGWSLGLSNDKAAMERGEHFSAFLGNFLP